jgi:hypothetical protein
MKPFSLTVTLVLLGAALAAGVVGAGAVALTQLNANNAASSSSDKASKYCDSFFGHLSSDIGKSQTDVKNAINQAIDQTLSDAVHNGDLTQDQANNIKNQISQSGGGCQALQSLKNTVGRGKRAAGIAALAFSLDAAAKALSMTPADLKAQLAAGKTLHQLADSKGVSQAQFIASVKTALKTRLDTAVKNGKLTQSQEDAMLSRVDQLVNRVWDRNLAGAAKRVPRAPKASPLPAQ